METHKLAKLVLGVLMILIAMLSCTDYNDPYGEVIFLSDLFTDDPNLTPTSTLKPCGGYVSGNWWGSATDSTESVEYSMKLWQTEDCQVTGTSQSGGKITATIKGYVDQGIFHFSESGDGNNCYWTGNLTIEPKFGLDMSGDVTNCSKKHILLRHR